MLLLLSLFPGKAFAFPDAKADALAVLPDRAQTSLTLRMASALEIGADASPARAKPAAKSGKRKQRQPTLISAERMTGQTESVTRAEGKVELRSADGLAFADALEYFSLEDTVEARGNVRLIREGMELSGPYLKMRLADQIGHMEDAAYKIERTLTVKRSGNALSEAADDAPALRTSAVFGIASRIHLEGENQFRLENSTYSTCRPEKRDWYTKSEETRLDFDRSEGEAKNATLFFQDVPILYTPYLAFPLSNARESGFLMPTYGSSTRTGLDFSLPWYWNIAPNYDATLTPRLMSKRGLQLGSEVRYRGHYNRSELRFEYLARDEQFNDRRYAYEWKFQQNLGGGFSTSFDWNGVSDDEYFTDLSSRIVQTSQRQLPRQFHLNYNREGFSAQLRTLRYQTLNPADSNSNYLRQPYFLMPRLDASARRMLWDTLDFKAVGQYTRFSHPTLERGDRSVLYPQLSLPFERPGYYVTPKIGLHMTRYQLTQRRAGLPETLSRNLPIFSLDSGMTLERDFTFFDRQWTQTLEPRFYYLDIPYRNQSAFPVFDTGLADFNFGQIFSENRFSGYDRVNNARQLTVALTSRLIDPETGSERLRAMVGQRRYFRELKIGLPNETLETTKTSHFLAALSGQALPKTYIDSALEYSDKRSKTQRYLLALRYQPDPGKTLSATYRYNRGVQASVSSSAPVKQIDLAGQWRLAGGWYAVGRYNYSFDTSRLIEGIAGVEYNAGCWAARFVTQRLETTAGKPNTSFFFQLELSDFGQLGSNPMSLLRRSIPGYSKINALPDDEADTLFPTETW